MAKAYPELPLSTLKADFAHALTTGSLLLEAEPGAGKSTLAPLWALEAAGDKEIWLVQPRVLAAINLARRLADAQGESVGQTVGYQVPFDHRRGRDTRMLVMTPGVLLQRLLHDPELANVDCVLLDEIHERSVDQDLAWALLQEAAILNESLSLVLMSATPDTALRQQVDNALFAPGRCHPVSVSYCPPQAKGRRDEPLAGHVLRALRSHEGWQQETALVFLPGWRAIADCRRALTEHHPRQPVFCLHSRVDHREQTAALDPNHGPRVILATNIAETSLTIADVTLVIDSGLSREPDFEQRTGITRLQTRRIALANAEQRRGRAGRVQAGHCMRLWAEGEALAQQTQPAIRRSDYLPLTLRLAHWGTPPEQLPWLESPNPLALEHARHALKRWQFVDDHGAITASGRLVSRLGTHPRIAAILIHSGDALAAHPWLLLLALALHFDWPAEPSLAQWLQDAATEYQRNKKWQQLAKRWQQVLAIQTQPDAQIAPLPDALTDRLAGLLTDRLGHRTNSGRYRLNCGVSVNIDSTSDWALVFHISRHGQEHRGVGLGIAPSQARIRELAAPEQTLELTGQGKGRRWVAQTTYYLGGQPVDTLQRELSAAEIPAAIMQRIREQGMAQLHWPEPALSLLLRTRWAQKLGLLDLPDLDEAHLLARLPDWLGGFLSAQSDLAQLPLKQGLAFYLGFDAQRQLDELVPAQVKLPSGRRVAVDYQDTHDPANLIAGSALPTPVIAAKLQEFFGVEHFAVGRIPVSLQLLSPAGQPLALTQDLAYFWREIYPQVRREMRGRYSKHPWPEDPLTHSATALTKRRLDNA